MLYCSSHLIDARWLKCLELSLQEENRTNEEKRLQEVRRAEENNDETHTKVVGMSRRSSTTSKASTAKCSRGVGSSKGKKKKTISVLPMNTDDEEDEVRASGTGTERSCI